MKTCIKETKRVQFVQYGKTVKSDKNNIKRIVAEWKDEDGTYTTAIKDYFFMEPDDDMGEYFALEDSEDRTLIIARTKYVPNYEAGDEILDNCLMISIMQVDPRQKYGSKTRQYRGLGNTLTAEIVKKAKRTKCKNLIVDSHNDDFWDNSGLFRKANHPASSYDECLRYLPSENFDDFLNFLNSKMIKQAI